MLVLDSGNFSDNPTPLGERKTRTLLAAMGELGYGVVNVGERDIKQGWDTFADLTAEARFPFISANLVDSASGKPVLPPHRIVEATSPDGSRSLRVGVIGILRFNPLFKRPGPDGTELVIAHPLEPLKAEVAKLREQSVDVIVLLAALHRDDARRLVAEAPGIDFVIGSYGGVYTTTPDQQGDAWILYSGNQGKRVGETRVFIRDDAVRDQQTTIHMLTKVYPGSEAMMEFLNSRGRNEAAAETSQRKVAPPPRASDWVGGQICKNCHDPAYAQWEATSHATAFATLERERKQGRSDCQRCHVTGAGRSGGFIGVEATPHLVGVGCESCHGAGRRHVEQPETAYGRVTIQECLACHDAENSPKFDYYAYLPKVTHRSH